MGDRSGTAPGAMGLTGAAGLQLKKPAKKFGLQKPAKAVMGRPATGSVFGAAALDDAMDVKEELERLSQSKAARAAAQAAHDAATSQDPSVFDYDGAYDAMQEDRARARAEVRAVGQVERKAKYIGSIMEAHKECEIENDKIFERKLVKEAEAEAHLYGDKEKFLTSAYRKKLQAREEYEAAQKAKEAKEAREDVTKRSDMSHFYSNLLHGNVGAAAASDDDAARQRDAAYAASSGGKAAGAVAPEPSAAAATGAGSAAPRTEPGAAGAAAAGAATERAAAEGAAAERAAPSGEAAAAKADDLVAAIAAANAARASRPKAAPEPEAAPTTTAERRNDDDAVLSARERYLARKRQKL